jgi:FOG: Glucan-binding domain (YG repeat)
MILTKEKVMKKKLLKTLALTISLSSFGTISPSTSYRANAAEDYWKLINNSWYYMDSTGKVQTGWISYNDNWYYIDNNGVMKTGWVYDNGNWYYLYSDGSMAINTTINGYYLGSTGAWTINTTSSSSGNALKPQDIDGSHHLRGDIASSDRDNNAASQLTNYNLTLSDTGLRRLKVLSINLAQGRTTIDEARNNCIGKVVDGYKITDIKFFDQSFSTTTGNDADSKVKAIQNSNLVTYKSSSSYKYDAFLVFSCGNARGNEWEAMRVVVELEAV